MGKLLISFSSAHQHVKILKV